MGHNKEKGFSVIILLLVAVVLAVIGFGGWYIWVNGLKDSKMTESSTASNAPSKPSQIDETAKWVSVTTQGKAFSMKIPDGWSLTNYPNDFLGSTEVVYRPGTPAKVESEDTDYMGHTLRFRASIVAVDDAGLGPQWASPQPGLEESTQDFSLGSLTGKRFKGVFSLDLNQTLYEYIFDLGNGKKLDIVYTVYHGNGEKDDISTVEKAIKTIRLR